MNINLHLQEIYKDDYVKVDIDEAFKFIYVAWSKHPNSNTFRHIFQKLADLTIENQTKLWLSDARAIHYIEFADQNWLLREMAPMLKLSNLKKFARLTTEESLALLDVVRVYNMVELLTELGITTKLELFTTKEAALVWLLEDIDKA